MSDEYTDVDDADGFDGTDLDAEFAALLADPTMWESPGDGVADGIVDAIRSESELGAPAGSVIPLRRSWLRPALMGAAAMFVFVFGGIVALSALNGADERETFASELISTGLIDGAAGEVQLTVFDSGLRIDLDAPSLPRRDNGAYYEGWLKTVDGNLVPIGTFHEGRDVVLWAGVGLDRVEALTITLENAAAGQSPEQGSSGEVVLRTDVTP